MVTLKVLRRISRSRCGFLLLYLLAVTTQLIAQTATTLVLSPSTSPLPAKTAVTLTATVLEGATPVHPGLVTFCDASLTSQPTPANAPCAALAVVGTAQLTSAGTAVLKFVPGGGSHRYKAVFAGTKASATSTSTTQTLTVLPPTAPFATATAIASSGSAGSYTLTATVTATGVTTPALAGSVSFLDTTNTDTLGTVPLGAATLTPVPNFTNAPGSPVAVGTTPFAVAVGDFNGDGIADLAVANSDSNNVSILLGDGSGGFARAPGLPVAVGTNPYSVAVGDFNGDGIADLAVANYGSNNVSILLGDGSGGFAPAPGSPVAVDSGPFYVATGDFNGDGIADLAVTNYLSDNVSILLGDGNGGFTPAPGSPVAVGDFPAAVAVGDFDGDGIADLAVTNAGALANNVSILLGDGSGGFAPASGSPDAVGTAPNGVVTGDFNGDGIADLAVANFGSDNVSILLGDGSGGFAPAPGSPVAVGTTPHNLAVGDFNGDGVADLAVTNQDDNNVSILLGNGSGRFAPASGSPVAVGRSPYDVAVGDFNGDGIVDLAVTNSGSISDNVSILLNQETQTATAELTGVNIVGSGTHDVNASYPGDTNFSGSISATIPLTATRVVTTLALTANPTTSTFGEQVVLTATLSPSSSESITTSGQAVTFFNGATSLGTGTLASGVATLNVTTLPLGTNSLTAVYAGDTNFVASTSPAVPFTVTAGIPAITSVNPNAGQQGINNLNVAIEGQFTNWVQGSTTVSLGAGISVNSVTVGPAGAGFISQVLGDNPKGFWILNDGPGSGATAIDSSVNAFNGTYGTGVTTQGIAGPSWVQASGLVASFTGGTISFPTPLDLGSNGYTIEAWINPSLSSLTQTTRFVASGSGLNGYGFGTASGGALHFTSFAQHDYVTTGLTLLPNQWQYVGVVLDASNNANFYVNGSLVETVAGLLPTNVPTGDFTIGNQSPGLGHTDEIFTGGLAGISVYNTALTPAQVQAQYNAATATGASLTANVSIAANAAAGTRNLTVTTGAEVVTLNNGFTVTAGTPVITQVNPNSGAQGGSNVPVTITGNFTHFSATSVVTFGNPGVTVSAPTGTPTATSLTVNVSITGAAAPGPTSVTVTTGAEVATLTNGFTVTAGIPAITSVNPNTGQQGTNNLNVAIEGQFTNWVQGSTTVSLGAGISVNSVTVNPAGAGFISQVLGDSPKGFWILNDAPGSPTTAIDSSVNAFNGTYGTEVIPQGIAGPSWVQPSGLVASFTGGTISFPMPLFLGSNGYTIEAWINPSLSSLTQTTRFADSGTGLNGYGFGTASGARLHFTTFTQNDYFTTGPALLPNQWQYVGVVLDASNNANFYVNGSLAETVAPTNPMSPTTPPTGDFTIGNQSPGLGHTDEIFTGGLAGISVYNTALTPAQVQAQYNAATATGASLTANVSIAANAAAGTRNLTVTTGAEVVTLNNGFTVTAGTPVITQVNPNSGAQGGSNVPVTITGNFTHFSATSVVTFGNPGVTVSAPTGTPTATSLTVNVSITGAAAPGPTSVTVTTGAEVATLTNGFTVTAGIPAITSITASAGNGQTTVNGTSFPLPLVATVKDSIGDGVSGVTVTYTANPGGNGQSGTFSNSTSSIMATTNSSGVASSGTFTANSEVGSYTVTATTGTLSATFNLTNTPGAPATIVVTSGSGQGAAIGTAFTNPLIATVIDAGGNRVPGAMVTFTAPTGLTSSLVFSNASTTISEVTNVLGQASSGSMTANGIPGGPYDVQASVGSLAINFQLTNLGRSLTTFASLSTTAATIDVFGFGFTPPSGSLAFTDMTTGTPVTGPVTLDTSTAVASLQPQVPTRTGANTLPVWTTLADVNGDGILDLITSLYMTDSVSVQLGNGDGTFQAATNILIATGFGPAEVRAVSLGNAKVDLIVGSFNVNQIAVLLGTGDGTFGTPTFYTVGSATNTPTSLTTGDFNDDGKLDVAVANTGDNTISIFLGDGSGGLTLQTPSIRVGRDPEAIRAGDFNGDGYSDLAVANYSDGTVTTLLNDKEGTFTATTISVGSGAGSGPQALAINGSGSSLLLAVANYHDNTVSVMQSSGSGSFGAQTIIPVGKGPDDVNFADFNGDGVEDLAVSNYTDGTVNLALGSSGGSYTVLGPFSVGTAPYSAAVGDLNLDGTPDLAVANCFSNNTGVLLDGTLISVPYSGLSLPPGDSFNATYTPDNASKYGSSNTGNIAPESLRLSRGVQRKFSPERQE